MFLLISIIQSIIINHRTRQKDTEKQLLFAFCHGWLAEHAATTPVPIMCQNLVAKDAYKNRYNKVGDDIVYLKKQREIQKDIGF